MADSNLPSNSKSNNQCEEDEGNIITMVDVLEAEQQLEDNANAVLGPGDDKNCTYSEGYLKRQALYSCLTCLPAGTTERAGVCLACSYHCHGDHDLVELYTKRNFRCDCGNSLFKGVKCTLDPVKNSINENNSYNDNFKGVYCSCKRPYPDPEDATEDTMIQCVICEDWLHTGHLDSIVPKEDDYSEMICSLCMDKLPFLQYYLGYSVNKASKAEDKNESIVNISVTDGESPLKSPKHEKNSSSENNTCEDGQSKSTTSVNQETESNADSKEILLQTNCKIEENNLSLSTETKENATENVGTEQAKNECCKKITTVSENTKTENVNTTSPIKESNSDEAKEKNTECLIKSLKMLPRGSGATFWPNGFRKLFCTCASCLEMYKDNNVSFLPDEEDTIEFYEDEGKSRKIKTHTTQYERGMEALSSLDRVQQMEAIISYNEMKTHLSEYLTKFVQNKKVVREEDIREFFSGMQARKRQKLDIPYNCR